jgi:hypothetical protein
VCVIERENEKEGENKIVRNKKCEKDRNGK